MSGHSGFAILGCAVSARVGCSGVGVPDCSEATGFWLRDTRRGPKR